jgi:hypothetical protein
MSHEIKWSASTCIKNSNIEGLKGALKQLDGLPDNVKNAMLGDLVLTAMVGQNNDALDQLLKHTSKEGFPAGSIADGLHYYVDPGNDAKIGKLVTILSYHTEKMTPDLKADVGFELAAYANDQTFARARELGVMDASECTKSNFRLHGLRNLQNIHPERIADLVKEMPEEARGKFYDKSFANSERTQTMSAAFIKEVAKDEFLFTRDAVNKQPFEAHRAAPAIPAVESHLPGLPSIESVSLNAAAAYRQPEERKSTLNLSV